MVRSAKAVNSAPKSTFRQNRRQSRSLLFVTALLSALAITTWGNPDFRPAWRVEPVGHWDDNLSFFSDLSSRSKADPLAWIMDPNWARDRKFEYERMAHEYEFRQRYHLSNLQLELEQARKLRDFSAGVIDQLRIQNFVRERDRATGYLRKSIRIDLTGKGVLQRSAVMAGVLLAVGTGTPVPARLSESTELTAYLNAPYRMTYLQLRSPVLDSTLTYVGDSANPNLPFELPPEMKPPEWVKRGELYTVRASRGLPIWSLGTSLMYGGSSYMVTSTLSKQITPQLSAAIDASIPAHPEKSASKDPTQTIHFDYKLSF